MATSQRQTDASLMERIAASRFADGDDFFELVRLLERTTRARADAICALPGHDGPLDREPVRFHASQHAAFPGRAVERIRPREGNDEHVDMDVSFFGLTGPTGVLPTHYGNLVQTRLKQRDSALADFLDLFNHRLIGLFYRSWGKYRLALQHEANPENNGFARALRALAGQHPLQHFDPRLFYGGHFSRYTRSASNLERLLGDFLDAGVHVDAFIGHWIPIARDHRLRIGTGDRGQNNRLGEGVMPGKRAWDMQSKFCIHIGPISDGRYAQCMPGGPRFDALRRLIEEYVPQHLDIELRYLIRGEQLRALGTRLQLGLNVWLQRDPRAMRTARIQLRRRRAADDTTSPISTIANDPILRKKCSWNSIN